MLIILIDYWGQQIQNSIPPIPPVPMEDGEGGGGAGEEIEMGREGGKEARGGRWDGEGGSGGIMRQGHVFFFRQEFPFVSLERWSPTCVGLLVCAV